MYYTQYVDPFIGTDETEFRVRDDLCKTWFFIKAQCGNTYPGPCLPFGMLSVCPYTGGYPTGYGCHCPNYNGRVPKFSNELPLRGFTHFHHSGTGAIDHYYNYVRIFPAPQSSASAEAVFSGVNEKAAAGYYSVEIPDYSALAELTIASNAAAHRYTFSQGGRLAVDFAQSGLSKQFDPKFRKPVEKLLVRAEGPGQVCAEISVDNITLFAYVIAPQNPGVPSLWNGSLDNITHNTAMELNAPLDCAGAVFEHAEGVHELYAGFSLTSAHNAKDNALAAAAAGFDRLHAEAEAVWEQTLSRAAIDSDDENLKKIYYTALYHSLVKPSFFGADGGDNGTYLDFATLWDMYKTQMPLVNSLYGETASGMCMALVEKGERAGNIPISMLMNGGFDPCKNQAKMLGAHVLADAYFRGVKNIDWQRVMNLHERELGGEANAGFLDGEFPYRYTHLLDFAEACASCNIISKEIGNPKQAERFAVPANRWSDVFDKDTALLSLKSNYYEGTNYNYSFRLLHDMAARIKMAGGPDAFTKMLDDFFGYGAPAAVQQTDPNDRDLMQRGHELHRFEGYNNEPDIEAPYAYLYTGRHDRLCEIVRYGMRSMFHEGRGGLPGNDDSGGLSSCFVWNALGIFPAVGQDIMLLGSPAIKGARLKLHNGNDFIIEVHGQSEENIYVEKLIFNGAPLGRCRLTVREFMQGGKLEFFMCSKADSSAFPSIELFDN